MPVSDYDPIFQSAGREWDVDPTLLKAIAHQESGGDPRSLSSAGASGVMQIMPKTGQGLGLQDPTDPVQSIYAGAKYMSQLLDTHKDVPTALAAYNAGPGTVAAVAAGKRAMPAETLAYVPAVTAHYKRFAAAGMPQGQQAAQASPSMMPDSDFLAMTARGQPAAPAAAQSNGLIPDDQFLSSTGAAAQSAPVNPALEPTVADKPVITGNAANAAAGVVEGGTGVLNALSDPFGNLIGKPLVAAGLALHHAIAPALGFQDLTPQQRAGILGDDVPQPGTRFANAVGQAIGAPSLDQVQPADSTEKMIRAGAAGAVGLAAFSPGKVISSALTGAAGGMAGQAASDAAPEPYKPIAGILGNAAVLGAAGGVGMGVNKLMGSSDPGVISAVTDHGIPLRAGQVTQNKFLRYVDSAVGDLPFSGREASNAAQRVAVNTDAARSMGITPAYAQANNLPVGKITPAVMMEAKKLNGGVMNGVESRTTISEDPALLNQMAMIDSEASKSPSSYGDIGPHVTDVLDTFIKNNGTIPGKAYGDLVGHGSPLDVASRSSNSVVSEYAGRIKSALEDAMARSASPEDAAAYNLARYRYKNMMTLAPLVNKGIPGDISPLLLQSAANRSFKNNAFQGAGDLGSLGDVAQTYLKEPPNSGTATRMMINQTLYGHAVAAARGGLGLVGGRLAGTLLDRSPVYTPQVGIPGALPASLLPQNRLMGPSDQR